VDPIADQFAHVSVYNYAENEPIAHVDLWGLQKADPPDQKMGPFEIMGTEFVASVKTLINAALGNKPNIAQNIQGNNTSYKETGGTSGSNMEFHSETDLLSNGAVSHPKAINGTDQIFTQKDFVTMPGAGGAGNPAPIWKIKSAYDGVDAAKNIGSGINIAKEINRQRTAVDSFCISGSACAYGGKPHPGFGYYRVNVFGVRLDTIVNK